MQKVTLVILNYKEIPHLRVPGNGIKDSMGYWKPGKTCENLNIWGPFRRINGLTEEGKGF